MSWVLITVQTPFSVECCQAGPRHVCHHVHPQGSRRFRGTSVVTERRSITKQHFHD